MRRFETVAVVLVGHGSKAKGFNRAMVRVAWQLRREGYRHVLCAYLEINSPSIPEAIRQAVHLGARDVRVLPYFVLAGNHVRKDIPRIVRKAQKKNPGIYITLCPYLGYDNRIVDVVKDRLHRGDS